MLTPILDKSIKTQNERYNAENRFFGMNKLKQTMAKITGKWKKFQELSEEAKYTDDEKRQEEITEEFKGMFR